MAVGTPEELEHLVGAKRTVIQLEQVTDAVLNSLKKLGLDKIVHDENKLTVELANPTRENPEVVRAIVEAGGRVQSVSVSSSSLEDAYLKLVREQK